MLECLHEDVLRARMDILATEITPFKSHALEDELTPYVAAWQAENLEAGAPPKVEEHGLAWTPATIGQASVTRTWSSSFSRRSTGGKEGKLRAQGHRRWWSEGGRSWLR